MAPVSRVPFPVPESLTERYEILRTVGKGASGVVVLARDRRLGRDVAVKLLNHRSTEQEQLFDHEARTLAALEHEHTVRVYDYGWTEGAPYLVMELVRGMSLSARLAAERPHIAEAVTLTLQILAGVGAAHARGIIHRDLKPGNIFVDHAGRVKVGDFGLALSPHARADLTELTGAVCGTPSYMAPEQMRAKTLTPAADIFAVGLILHEMLTGQRLYPGDDPMQVFANRLQHTPPPPSRLDPRVPVALDQIVAGALALEPAQRSTLEQLSTSLSHWLERARAHTPRGALPATPYKLLEHFGPEDAPIFFGREPETNDLLELVDHPRVRLLMIFGRCGIGKSSLLRAGLIAGLDPARMEPILLISGPDPARSLREALVTRAAQVGARTAAGEPFTTEELELKPSLVLDLLVRLADASGRTPVVLLDQLEELFTQNPRGHPRIADLFCTVERIVEAQTLKAKLVLSFRSEFRGDFFPLEERLGAHLRSFAIREMEIPGLEAAIESPSRIDAFNFRYAPGFAHQLAREIAAARDHEGAALPVLQIICAQLYEHARASGGTVDQHLYETALGGARGALARWVKDRLASPHYAYQGALARQVLRALTIKEEGKERFACARDEDELLEFPDRQAARTTLERLITDQLVVRDAAEGGKRCVRLASEVICPLVESWELEPDEVEKASRTLARGCRQWDELGRASDHLLPASSIGLIRKHLGAMKGVSDLERAYLAASVRRRRLILVAITCFNLLWIIETGLIGIFPQPHLIDRALVTLCGWLGIAY